MDTVEVDASLIGDMHSDFEKATDSLHGLVSEAKAASAAIQKSNELFSGNLKKMYDQNS